MSEREPATPVEDRLDSVIRDLYPRTSLAVLAYEATERIRELKRLAQAVKAAEGGIPMTISNKAKGNKP